MGFEPFFSSRPSSAEANASHTWRPALPPIDRPIAPLAAATTGDAPTSASRRTAAPVSLTKAFRDERQGRG